MESLPDAAPLLELINGFRKSKVLFALVQLGIPDLLESNPQSTASHLAAQLRASTDGVERLLSAACSLQLLEQQEGCYHNSALAANYLTSSSPLSLCGYIIHSDRLLYPLWSGLESSVRSGQPSWEQAGGTSGAEVWNNTYKTKDDKVRFMRGMHSFAALSAAQIVTAFDLGGCSKLVDLGGATGTLAAAMCSHYHQLSAVVVDLPEIVDLAKDQFAGAPYISDASVLQRCRWFAADFFQQPELIPAGDVFLLARILHDWEESKCVYLLRLVLSKLPPGGKLLVCEMLLQDGGLGPPAALLQSLNMLVGWRGRERSLQQYKQLLEHVGFVNVEAQVTGSYLDVVKAEKPVAPAASL